METTLQTPHKIRNINSPGFMVLLCIAGYLLLDFMPSFGAVESVSPQYLYLAVLNIIIGVYCYCSPEIVNQNLISIFRNSKVLKIYGAFLILCGLSVINAGTVSLALVSFTHLILVFCMFVNFAILLYNRLDLLYPIVLMVGISVLLQSMKVLYDFSNTLDLTRIKGNTGNINILAACLNIKIPFLILGIAHFTKWKRGILMLALFLAVTIIFLTASRATFLGLALQVTLFIGFYVKFYTLKKEGIVKISGILIPILISFISVNMIFEKVGDSGRYKSILSRVNQIELTNAPTDSSAKLRLDFWENAAKISFNEPLTGVGIGNWKIESLPYENTLINDSDISRNTHNDFLEIAAETGIINGLLYLSLFVVVFYINIKRVLKAKDKQVQSIAVLALMLLFSYGIDALLNFPLHIPVMQVGFCFMLVFTLINTSGIVPDAVKQKTPVTGVFVKTSLVTITIIGVVCFFFAFAQFKATRFEFKFKIYQALYRANKTSPNVDAIEANYLKNNLPKFPVVSHYAEPFAEYVGVSLFYEKNYTEALEYFKQAEKVNPYLGISDWYIHKIEFIKGNTENAYKYVKSAFYKRPRSTDFYLSALFMANEKKDTLEMIKIHDLYSKYRKVPGNWIHTSNALEKSGYSTKSLISFLNNGLQEFPNDSLLLKKRAGYYAGARDVFLIKAQQYGKELKFDKALENYKKALEVDPQSYVVIQNIGICYYKLNDFKNAIAYLSKIKQTPGSIDGKTEFVLGLSYIGLKNKEQACKYLHKASEKNFAGANDMKNHICK